MAGNLTAMIAAAFSGGAAPPVTTDPYFDYTTLLLPGNGTNGAQNNTFLDGSANNFTITRNGNTTQGTFSPFSQTGWGAYFDGASDYIQFTNSDFSVSTGDFTAEWWMFVTSDKSQVGVMTAASNANLTIGYGSGSANARQVYVEWGGSGAYIGSMSNYANSWVHICVMRSSGTVYTFQNGTLLSSASKSAALGSTANMVIGTNSGDIAAQSFPGYLSNVRFSKVAVYSTSGFTPSTSPLTRTSQGATNVQFLTLQSSRFLDSNGVNTPASSPLTITKNGDTSVVAFSPFNPSAAYSAATNGGSGYFDGSGDYLNLGGQSAFAFGTGDFTLEGWFYFNALGNSIYDARPSGTFGGNYLTVGVLSSGQVEILINTVQISAGAVTINQWTHIAITRSGTDLRLFVNGAQAGSTVTNSTNLINAASRPTIGVNGANTGVAYVNGYIGGYRVVTGTAVYTSNFTPPTAPLTNITNTSLLLNFTNAGVYDATSKVVLETVNSSSISNAITPKWGSTSIKFASSTSDYLWTNNQTAQVQTFGTGDFTIEGWVYLSTINTAFGIISRGTSTTGWSVNITSGNKLQFSYTTSTLTGATSLVQNTWYYFAVVRSGSASGNLKLYLATSGAISSADATSAGAVTDNFNQTNALYVGADRVGTSLLNGYLQDIRMTNYARAITATPTAAFPLL